MLWLEIKLINPLPRYRKAVKFKLSFFRPHGYRIFISNRFKFTDTSRLRPFSCAAMPVWYLSIQMVHQREPDLANINLLSFSFVYLWFLFNFLQTDWSNFPMLHARIKQERLKTQRNAGFFLFQRYKTDVAHFCQESCVSELRFNCQKVRTWS